MFSQDHIVYVSIAFGSKNYPVFVSIKSNCIQLLHRIGFRLGPFSKRNVLVAIRMIRFVDRRYLAII